MVPQFSASDFLYPGMQFRVVQSQIPDKPQGLVSRQKQQVDEQDAYRLLLEAVPEGGGAVDLLRGAAEGTVDEGIEQGRILFVREGQEHGRWWAHSVFQLPRT